MVPPTMESPQVDQMRSNGTNESALCLAHLSKPVLPVLPEGLAQGRYGNEGMTQVPYKCSSGSECYSPEVDTQGR